MELIDLPFMNDTTHHRLIDWSVDEPPAPDAFLLSESRKARRSIKGGIPQTAISKKRQNFITGMNRGRTSRVELDARLVYNEEFRIRMLAND